MNDLAKINHGEGGGRKCPFGKLSHFFKNILQYVLDYNHKEIELLNKMNFLALENLKNIPWKERIENDRISYHLEWRELNDFFEHIGVEATEDIPFTEEERKIFISMCRDKKIVTRETYKYYFGSLIGVAMFDIFTAIMLKDNFKIDKRKCLMMLLKNMQKGAKVSSNRDYLSNKIMGKMLRDVDNVSGLIKDLLNQYEYKHKKAGDSPSCPFMRSEKKIVWLEEVWEVLENNFIPNMKDICSPAYSGDGESYFYLGRFQELKKEG